jgi:hypothetical protein
MLVRDQGGIISHPLIHLLHSSNASVSSRNRESKPRELYRLSASKLECFNTCHFFVLKINTREGRCVSTTPHGFLFLKRAFLTVL